MNKQDTEIFKHGRDNYLEYEINLIFAIMNLSGKEYLSNSDFYNFMKIIGQS